jgi:Domain of unknown function (DUF4287)
VASPEHSDVLYEVDAGTPQSGGGARKTRGSLEIGAKKLEEVKRGRTVEAERMTYKAYIDNIKAKTGKDPEYFRTLAREKGLATHGELLTWLKSDCGLGHGHANAIILYVQNPELAKKEDASGCTERKAKK